MKEGDCNEGSGRSGGGGGFGDSPGSLQRLKNWVRWVNQPRKKVPPRQKRCRKTDDPRGGNQRTRRGEEGEKKAIGRWFSSTWRLVRMWISRPQLVLTLEDGGGSDFTESH